MAERLVDPEERPIDPERWRIWLWVGVLAVIAGLIAAWCWTPLGEWVEIPSLVERGQRIKDSPVAPLAVLGCFVAGSVLFVPATVMVVATVLVFGPGLGFVYSLAGSLTGALVTYWLGAVVGREGLRRMAGPRMKRVGRTLARRGVLTIVIFRLTPIAPFAVINTVAGAAHIRLRDFMIGTFLGMLPGLMAAALLMDRVTAAIRAPSPATIGTLIAAVAVLLVAVVLIHRWLAARAPAEGTAGVENAGQAARD